MSNNTEYHVTFSYDLTQTGNKKYDSFMRMAGEKQGAVLDKVYEDDYGLKDLVFTSINDVSKLNEFVKVVFQDLIKKNVRVSASAHKYEYVLKIDESNVKDKEGFTNLIKKWTDEKNISLNKADKSLDITFPNKELKAEFLTDVLPQTTAHTKKNQLPSVEEDWNTIPHYNGNNYVEKNKHRM